MREEIVAKKAFKELKEVREFQVYEEPVFRAIFNGLLTPGDSGAGEALAQGKVVANFWQNLGKISLVFGCIGTDLCKSIRVLQHFLKSTRLSS